MENSNSVRFRTILGIPRTREDINNFRNNIWKRYTKQDFPNHEDVDINTIDRASAYLERIIDRMINKARGILPFNSLLILVTNLAKRQDSTPILVDITFTFLIFSSIMLLALFWVHWGKIDHYKTAQDEFAASVIMIWVRSFILQIALLLSFCSIFGIILIAIFDPLPHQFVTPFTSPFTHTTKMPVPSQQNQSKGSDNQAGEQQDLNPPTPLSKGGNAPGK